MTYRTLGGTIVEWNDVAPFVFSLTQDVGPRNRTESETITIDLTKLRHGFTDDFLESLKDHLIERSNQVRINTILTTAAELKGLFGEIIDRKLFEKKISVIDEGFLLCLASEQTKFRARWLSALKRTFSIAPQSPLFSKKLLESDFPTHEDKRTEQGRRISNILSKALTRAAVAHILDLCDVAYADRSMDIGHYSYVHLAFAVFVRPNSYRQIRLCDLRATTTGQYFIDIVTAKTGEKYPSTTSFRINETLGVLLTKQRQYVIETYGPMVAKGEVSKLALFPARRLIETEGEIRWQSEYANLHQGMHSDSRAFICAYPNAIKRHLEGERHTLNSNALRHTVGTLLAQTGASEKTLQAVLKHATPLVCRAYVDIAFHGLMEEISEAMLPAFSEHLPALVNFRSKSDLTPPEKEIFSQDPDSGNLELTGECGKRIACENAPIVCYGCVRFLPCWDADHSINLRLAEKEIDDMSRRGKPFEHMVDRARSAKNKILLVMYAAERYRQAHEAGAKS